MLSSSLAGTKVTAATRVQTVKRNTTVRAATQKMGAKGKKRGGKVRVALSFYFVLENCAPQISLFRFEGGEQRYLGPICLDQERERERFNFGIFSLRRRESAAVAGLFVARRRKVSFHRRNSLRARGILSLVEQRGRKKRVCVCFPWGLSSSPKKKHHQKPPFFRLFFRNLISFASDVCSFSQKSQYNFL